MVIDRTEAHQYAHINCSQHLLHKKDEHNKPWKALGIAYEAHNAMPDDRDECPLPLQIEARQSSRCSTSLLSSTSQLDSLHRHCLKVGLANL